MCVLKAKHPRAINTAELRNLLCKGGSSAVPPEVSASLDKNCVFSALRGAIEHAAQDSLAISSSTISTQKPVEESDRADAVVIVCGTAFIMSDARFELGVDEARDGEELFFSPAQLMPTVSIARDAQPKNGVVEVVVDVKK